MADKRKPVLPPSLSSIPGESGHFYAEEQQTLRRLEQAIRDLPLKEGGTDTSIAAARELLSDRKLATAARTEQRKSGTASPMGVERGLKQIASRSRTLLDLLKRTDRNTFEKWADAAEGVEHNQAVQEWLQLKNLLAYTTERATAAAQATNCLARRWPAAGSKGGRPPDTLADLITNTAANIYEQRTGATASRVIDALNKPCGGFHEFLERVFEALGIDSSPNASNARLQRRRVKKQ